MKAERNSKVVHSAKARKGSFPTLSVPTGWDICEFSEVFAFISTNSFSREQMSYQIEPTSYFNIHYGDIHASFNQQILDFRKHESQVPVLIHAPRYVNGDALLRDGDLIIADASEDYNGVGECIELVNVNGKKVLSGLHTIAARDKAGRTHEGFRAYLLSHPQVSNNLKRIATGSKVYGVSKTNIATLALALPPLPEQRKIALILSTWDRAIEKTEQLITQKQQLKKGLMQQLLTGRVRFKEFVKSKKMKKTKLGMVSTDWEAPKFGELFSMTSGSTPSRGVPSFFQGNVLWVTSGELDHKVVYDTREKISREAVRKTNLTIYPAGTFLIAITGLEAAGTRGRCAILGEEAAVNQSCMAFESRPDVDAWYLFYFYRFFSEELTFSFAQGSKQQSLPKKVLDNITFLKPPIQEQRKISSVLLEIDSAIHKLDEALKCAKMQKKGLMQQLLTGKVRVKI